MAAYLSANGQHVTELSLLVPYYGAPVADIALASSAALASPVTLTIGNLTLSMAIARRPGGTQAVSTFAGVTTARLVGGAGGWPTLVSLTPYRNPEGVLLSTVLGDVAAAAKNPVSLAAESVSLAAGLDRSLGAFYVPETGAPASRLLACLAGSLWWVDKAGVTQVASSRPSSTITTSAQVEALDGGKGWLRIASEDVAGWATPGASYTSAQVPQGVTVSAARVHVDNEGTLRVEVLAV